MERSVEQKQECARAFDPASVPSFDGEEWREVPGYEGIYMVSSHGRFLSLERRCPTPIAGGTRRVRQRLRKATVIRFKDGRVSSMCVSLSVPGRPQGSASVGLIVLRAFVGDRPGMVAHFKDGDPTNARLENMEWSTYSAISIANGSLPPPRWPSQRMGVAA